MTARDDFFPILQTYHQLRTSIVSYLRRLGSRSAEDLADETVVRVLEKQKAGAAIEDIRAYALGVAANVYRESVRGPRLVALPQDLALYQMSEDAESLDKCLGFCMKKLPLLDRRILRVYYSGTGRHQIENRRKLADELGITIAALRLRAYRLRQRLESCIEECLERDKQL